MRSRSLIIALMLLIPSVRLEAQFPPASIKNVKALPAGITMHELIDTMKSFTRALGVRCTYCHVGSEDIDLDKYDFVTDEKLAKQKARQMIAMVTAINSKYLSELDSRRDPPIAVTCATCHRGVPQPRPLTQILLTRFDEAGADSAIATYQALRRRYFGGDSYDFDEVTLVNVADVISERGKPTEALKFYRLNTEMVPTSGFAQRSAATGFLAVGDTASAIAAYNKALVINAKDQQSISALAKLKH